MLSYRILLQKNQKQVYSKKEEKGPIVLFHFRFGVKIKKAKRRKELFSGFECKPTYSPLVGYLVVQSSF